jgi:MarR family 2-MHQ and catechol resistance regulon transcriptional repressor
MADTKDDSLELFIVLARANEWVTAHAYQDIRRHGLNPTEFAVIELLYHKGKQPLQQIGEKILMTSGNITYVIDKLEKKGYVCRKASPEDRRVIYAEITDQGRVFLDGVFPNHKEVIQQAVGGLTPNERQQVIQLLKKLGKYAENSFQK